MPRVEQIIARIAPLVLVLCNSWGLMGLKCQGVSCEVIRRVIGA